MHAVKRFGMEAAIVGVVLGPVVALLLAFAGQALYAYVLGTP